MILSTRSKILIGAIILAEIILLILGFNYRRSFNEDFELVSGEVFDKSVVLEMYLDQPSFPTSFESMETLGLQLASTGRVYEYQLTDSEAGTTLGTAIVLEMIARERDDPDNLKKIPAIVQFIPASDPNRNVMPWVLERAAELGSVEISEEILSEEQVAQVFPRGTIWLVIPLFDLNKEELEQLVEYGSYAEKYYGGSIYPKLDDMIKDAPDKHPILSEAPQPIFLLDIFSIFDE